MKKFLSTLCATALTASLAATSVLPVTAAPVFVPKAPAVQSDVIQIRHRSGNWNNNYGWYNGHRGYRYKRYGYNHYHNGYWYPAAAFVAGTLIGGAVANNNRYYNNGYGGSSGHVQWCYDRYRSYREYDNTFQPYNGPRQQCYSPYN